MAFRGIKLNFKTLTVLVFVFLLFVYLRPDKITSNMWTWRRTMHNILDAQYEPKKDGKSIFFVETNKVSDNVIRLTPRQSCSVESAGESEYRGADLTQ